MNTEIHFLLYCHICLLWRMNTDCNNSHKAIQIFIIVNKSIYLNAVLILTSKSISLPTIYQINIP